MKRLHSYYASFKAWMRLCPFRKGRSGIALVFDVDELDLNFESKIPKDFFDTKEPFTLKSPDRRVVLSAHLSQQNTAPGLVYIVLPKETA